jgi:hypothetical protein
MKVLIHSREILDPLKEGGPYFKVSFQVVENKNKVVGKAWVRGLKHLSVTEEQTIDESPIEIAKSIKYWLWVNLEQLIKEYDGQWTNKT